MPTSLEAVKERIGDPFLIREKLEAAGREGFVSLSEDDQFLAKWYGLYTHRHEPGYFMLRLKIPNGFILAAQLKVVARIAAEENRDFADITTRQDIQLHWIAAGKIAAILTELEQAGLSSLGACGDIMRNFVGCPVAGIDAQEYFDASPVLLEAHKFFLGNRDFANLPRKFKVSISACRDQCTQPEIQCVGFVGCGRSTKKGEQLGFDVRVGGGLSTRPYYAQRLNVFVEPAKATALLAAISEIYRDAAEYRNTRGRARFKFLIADWGVTRFRQTLQQKVDFPLEEAGHIEDPPDSYKDHVGVHEQKQPGLFMIGIPVMIGRVTGTQMKKVADLAERHADGSVRLTVRQNLLMVNVPKENVAPILEGLQSVGLTVNASPILRGVVTCTGTEFCKLAVTETKARSREIVEYLEARVRLEEPLRIHVTGCPNTCAQSPIAHIGLQGSKGKDGEESIETYDVAVGGQLGRDRLFNRFVLRKIPASEVKVRIAQLLVGYKKMRHNGELFNDFCKRIGDEEIVKLLSAREEPA